MTEHSERPGFWIWFAVHAELIPSWSWPVLVVLEVAVIYMEQGYR